MNVPCLTFEKTAYLQDNRDRFDTPLCEAQEGSRGIWSREHVKRGREGSFSSPNPLASCHRIASRKFPARQTRVSRGNSCPFGNHVAQRLQQWPVAQDRSIRGLCSEPDAWHPRSRNRESRRLQYLRNKYHCPVKNGNIVPLRRLPIPRRLPRGSGTLLRMLLQGIFRYQSSPP